VQTHTKEEVEEELAKYRLFNHPFVQVRCL